VVSSAATLSLACCAALCLAACSSSSGSDGNGVDDVIAPVDAPGENFAETVQETTPADIPADDPGPPPFSGVVPAIFTFCHEMDPTAPGDAVTLKHHNGDLKYHVSSQEPGDKEAKQFMPLHPFRVDRVRLHFMGTPGAGAIRVVGDYGGSRPDETVDLVPPRDILLAVSRHSGGIPYVYENLVGQDNRIVAIQLAGGGLPTDRPSGRGSR